MNRARFTWRLWDDGVLTVLDLDLGGRSVTNDVEQVVRDLAGFGLDLDSLRIVYRDSEGLWDGIATHQKAFAGFIPLHARRMSEAIREARDRSVWEAR